MRRSYPAALVLVLLIVVSFALPARADGNSSSLTLTVFPDGSVGIAVSSTQTSMLSPGTEPNVTLGAQASTANGQTTVNVSGTASLPAPLLKQAPYNYSRNSVSMSGTYSDGRERGSVVIQAVPGVSTPLSTFKLSYNGNDTFVDASGNGTLVYGNYANGVVLNASTIKNEIATAEKEGLNVSGLNRGLATLPYGNLTVEALTLNATYGTESAFLSGNIELKGNVTEVPFFVIADALFGVFSTTTTSSQVMTTTTTCSPQAPAYCDVTLFNSGSAVTVTGCDLDINSTSGPMSYSGTVTPANAVVGGGSSVDIMCSVPGGLSSSSESGFASIFGTLSLNNGASVDFAWATFGNQTTSDQTLENTTTASTTADTSTDMSVVSQTTTTEASSLALTEIASVYSAIFSSIQTYSYSATYSEGVMGFQATIHAANNFNLANAMRLLGGLESSEGANESVSSFLNSTTVDISNLKISLSELQQPSGEYVTQFSEDGLTIYPSVVVSGNRFNMSSLFSALGTTEENVTLVGGTNSAGSVNIEIPGGTPPPSATSPHSYTWRSVTANELAGIQFSIVQQNISTSNSTSTGSASSSTSSVSTKASTSTSASSTFTSNSVPEYPFQAELIVAFTMALLVFYMVVRRRPDKAADQ